MSTVWVSCLCSLRAVIKQIMDLQLKPDAPPAFYPFTITIAADSAAMKVADHLGALKRVSAAEPVHALLFAVAEAITTNQAIGVLQRWKTVLLSVPLAFMVVPEGDARFWKSHTLRQRAIEQGANES